MRNFFIIFFIIFSCSIFAKDFTSMETGSAKSIRGKTLVIVQYVAHESECDVPSNIRASFTKSLRMALNYIEFQCETSGVYAKFIVKEDNGSKCHLVPDYINMYEIEPEDVCKKIHGTERYAYELASRYECNNVIYIICTNSDKTCSAFSYASSGNVDYLEGCNIHMRDDGVIETIIVHEIFHCFGAWDLAYDYNFVNCDNPTKQKDMLKYSIMVNCYSKLRGVFIDDFTAYLIGMSNEYHSWFSTINRYRK